MTLEEEIINKAGKVMANDIDIEILMSAMDWKPFEFSEGRVYDARYLTVHPTNGSRWNEMMAWMIETFGPSGTPENPGCWSPDQRWYANNAKFWFREEKDRNWFVLKWSS
jgi:hypothetical protein